MEIYLGAMGQDKLKIAAKENGLKEELIGKKTLEIDLKHSFCWDEIKRKIGTYESGIIYFDHFHYYVKENLEHLLENEYWKEWIELLCEMDVSCSLVIIGDEIGCGVVPLEEKERNYREVYGRIMCELCKRARRVTRVVCGISQVIKEDFRNGIGTV